MKIKLNIQAIRIAEKLLKKPFDGFNLLDEETSIALMYGMVYANNEEAFTIDTFKTMLGQKKTASLIYSAVRKELDCITQFNSGESESSGDPLYMSDLASMMIAYGMDAHFVNYEMKLFEVPDYLKGIDLKKREQMESDRFWTYLSILPHVNSKKLKSPDSLVTFPWETEEKRRKAKEEIDKVVSIFKKFIKSKPV